VGSFILPGWPASSTEDGCHDRTLFSRSRPGLHTAFSANRHHPPATLSEDIAANHFFHCLHDLSEQTMRSVIHTDR